MSLLAELRRRHVIRVAGLYVVTAWLLIQIAETLLPIFHTPEWVLQTLVILLALGFIPALIISWVFELTPEGLKRESELARPEKPVDATARKLDVVVIVLLLGVAGMLLWQQHSPPDPRAPEASTSAAASAPAAEGADGAATLAKSVAVLPFENLSSDPEQGYFADGLTEEILNALASVPGLMVTARTSSFHFKDQNIPVDEIGERLGVEHLLEGSVRRSGDQLRVTAQLVRARDGFHLWSQVYDRDYTDAFAVQADIATQVASTLGILLDEVQRARMVGSGARDPEAYALFARGHELYRAAHNDAAQIPTLIEANRYFDQAVQSAPNMWAAHYHSADLYVHILLELAAGEDPAELPADEVARAAEALQARLGAALRTAPNVAARDFIQITYQLVSDDWRELGALFRRAYGHNDACGFSQWMHVGIPLGMADEAMRLARLGIACNAFDDNNWANAAYSALYAGDPQVALDTLDRALSLPDLSHGWARLQSRRVATLLAQGLPDQARAEALRAGPANVAARQMQLWLAAASGDAQRVAALRAEAAKHERAWTRALESAAIAGDRETANQLAASIDARSTGPMLLLIKTFYCLCGAPFDLQATPNLAARLQEADLPWPPESPIDWPLKDW